MYCRWKSFINFKNNLILVVSKKTDIPWTKKKKYKKLTVFGWVALESHIVRWSGAYFSVRTVSTTANCNDTRMTIVVGRCWCVLVVLVVLMGVCEKRWKKSLSHTWVARYFPWVRHPSSGTRDLVRCTMKVHCPRVHISCVVGFAKHSQTFVYSYRIDGIRSILDVSRRSGSRTWGRTCWIHGWQRTQEAG